MLEGATGRGHQKAMGGSMRDEEEVTNELDSQ